MKGAFERGSQHDPPFRVASAAANAVARQQLGWRPITLAVRRACRPSAHRPARSPQNAPSGSSRVPRDRALVLRAASCLDPDVPLLSREQYLATMDQHPTPVENADSAPVDLGGYIDQIPESDLGGYDFSHREVSRAWNTVEDKWQHVLIRCAVPNVYLVVVLDLAPPEIAGHYLLDLNAEYGIDGR